MDESIQCLRLSNIRQLSVVELTAVTSCFDHLALCSIATIEQYGKCSVRRTVNYSCVSISPRNALILSVAIKNDNGNATISQNLPNFNKIFKPLIKYFFRIFNIEVYRTRDKPFSQKHISNMNNRLFCGPPQPQSSLWSPWYMAPSTHRLCSYLNTFCLCPSSTSATTVTSIKITVQLHGNCWLQSSFPLRDSINENSRDKIVLKWCTILVLMETQANNCT